MNNFSSAIIYRQTLSCKITHTLVFFNPECIFESIFDLFINILCINLPKVTFINFSNGKLDHKRLYNLI